MEKGLEQRIGVAEALAGLHVWIQLLWFTGLRLAESFWEGWA